MIEASSDGIALLTIISGVEVAGEVADSAKQVLDELVREDKALCLDNVLSDSREIGKEAIHDLLGYIFL